MSISKQERYETENVIYTQRHDPGIVAIKQWLYIRRDELNNSWRNTISEDGNIERLQGEARMVDRLIRVIDTGPTIKEI